jgi:hypothetical protein
MPWLGGMDHRKLDAALSAAVGAGDETGSRLSVFVRTDGSLSREARATLQAVGVAPPDDQAAVFTAELTSADVATLAAQPWVKSIRLGHKMRPLPGR